MYINAVKTALMFIVIFLTAPQLCGSEEFWEQAVRRHCNTVSAEVASLALEVGWRSIFFTSKLQLQKLISRRRLKAEGQQEDKNSEPKSKAEESQDESSHSDQASRSDKESHPQLVSDLNLSTLPYASFDASCDADPGVSPEPEAGSDSNGPASEQPLQNKCVDETEADDCT